MVNRIYHPGKGTRDPIHSAGKQAAADTRFRLWHSTDTEIRRIVDGKQGALRQKLKQNRLQKLQKRCAYGIIRLRNRRLPDRRPTTVSPEITPSG